LVEKKKEAEQQCVVTSKLVKQRYITREGKTRR